METSLFIERVKNETNNKNNYLKIYFLIQNFFILYINLYYLLKSKKNLFKNNKFIMFYKENKFKNSDIFPISLAMRTYRRVSNLLNNKYFINIFSLIKKEENSNTHGFNLKRKAIRLYSVDLFDSKYHRKWLKKILRNKYYINLIQIIQIIYYIIFLEMSI